VDVNEAETPPADASAVRTDADLHEPPTFRWRSLGAGFWLLALSGLAWIAIGLYDFVVGFSIDARILGALNVTSGAVWLATAVGFRYRTVLTLAVVFSGAILAFVYGAYFVGQFVRFGLRNLAAVTIAAWMFLVAAYTLRVLHRTWTSYGLTKRTKDLIGAGKFGIPVLAIAAGIGALFQFWYTAAYGPSALPPNLAIQTTAERVGSQPNGQMDAYSVDVDIENVGQARVQTLASWFNVTVANLDRSPGSVVDRLHAGEGLTAQMLGQPRTSAEMTTAKRTVVAAGELLDRGWWFEPGERTHRQFLVYVDPTQGDLLEVFAGVEIARGARLIEDPSLRFECAGDAKPVDVIAWKSSEPAAIRQLTIPSIRLAYALVPSAEGTIEPIGCFETGGQWHDLPTEQVSDDMFATLVREYGLATTGSQSQLILWPNKDPAPTN